MQANMLVVVLMGIAAFFIVGILGQLLLRRLALQSRNLRLKVLRPYDALILKNAGTRFSPYATLKHIGRRSGREYQTPLGASPLGDGFVLGLAFGPEADWCRNVISASKATLVWHGHEYALENPEIIPAAVALGAYPGWKRFLLTRIGVKQYLWLHKQTEAPEEARTESLVAA